MSAAPTAAPPNACAEDRRVVACTASPPDTLRPARRLPRQTEKGGGSVRHTPAAARPTPHPRGPSPRPYEERRTRELEELRMTVPATAGSTSRDRTVSPMELRRAPAPDITTLPGALNHVRDGAVSLAALGLYVAATATLGTERRTWRRDASAARLGEIVGRTSEQVKPLLAELVRAGLLIRARQVPVAAADDTPDAAGLPRWVYRTRYLLPGREATP